MIAPTSGLGKALNSLAPDTRLTIMIGTGDFTLAQLRTALAYDEGERMLSTAEASALLGYSRSWWAEQAGAGRVHGAYRTGDNAPWRLPAASCRQHLARLQSEGRPKQPGRKRRGPWGANGNG